MTAHAQAVHTDDYASLCEKVRLICGVDLMQHKRGRMERRVRTWVERRGAASLPVYGDLLRRDPDELDAFLDRVTINVLSTDAIAALVEAAAALARADGVPSLAGIPVQVWAELGRASMPTAEVVGLPHGAVVELDRTPDDPIGLFVNGRRFATGRLVVVDGNDWAVRIEIVLTPSSDSSDTGGEGARCPVSS